MSGEKLWLDALPQEVCVRIAANAIQTNLDAVIHIGNVSPTLRAAVLQPLHQYYTFNQSRIFDYVVDHVRAEAAENEHVSTPVHISVPHHHSQTAEDSGSESAVPSSEEAHSSPDVSSGDQSPHGASPSAPDSQPPRQSNDYPDLREALQRVAGATGWTIRQAETMEEFWEKCKEDDQPSPQSSDVHPDQDGTGKPADDEDSHQSFSLSEEQPEHRSDPVHSESHSNDEVREGPFLDVPENGSDEDDEIQESCETHTSCESNSDREAENSLPSDEENAPEKEPLEVSIAKFQKKFAEFLGEDIRSAFVCGLVPELRSQPAFETCMASPLLEELVLGIPTDFYESFRVGPNLRKLLVMIAEEDSPLISYLQLLSSTKLRELRITGHSSVCLHRHLARDPETASLLSSWFPNVEILDIECSGCTDMEGSPAPMWSVIKHFRKLKEITLYERVPENAIELLSRMESVSLHSQEFHDLPERIPDRVVSVITNKYWSKGEVGKWSLDETKLERLANCSRLESLECCIKPGMERQLVCIAANLKSLGIAFDASGTPVGEKLIPLQPSDGAILDLVRVAPKLKSLRLINMRISRSELQEVLICTGDRLEIYEEVVFINSFVGQFVHQNSSFVFPKSENKQELELFVAILKTAALQNPKLERLCIDIRPEWFTDIRAVRSILDELRAACLVLTRRALNLDFSNLCEIYEKFYNSEIGMIHLFKSMCGNLGIPMVAVS